MNTGIIKFYCFMVTCCLLIVACGPGTMRPKRADLIGGRAPVNLKALTQDRDRFNQVIERYYSDYEMNASVNLALKNKVEGISFTGRDITEDEASETAVASDITLEILLMGRDASLSFSRRVGTTHQPLEMTASDSNSNPEGSEVQLQKVEIICFDSCNFIFVMIDGLVQGNGEAVSRLAILAKIVEQNGSFAIQTAFPAGIKTIEQARREREGADPEAAAPEEERAACRAVQSEQVVSRPDCWEELQLNMSDENKVAACQANRDVAADLFNCDDLLEALPAELAPVDPTLSGDDLELRQREEQPRCDAITDIEERNSDPVCTELFGMREAPATEPEPEVSMDNQCMDGNPLPILEQCRAHYREQIGMGHGGDVTVIDTLIALVEGYCRRQESAGSPDSSCQSTLDGLNEEKNELMADAIVDGPEATGLNEDGFAIDSSECNGDTDQEGNPIPSDHATANFAAMLTCQISYRAGWLQHNLNACDAGEPRCNQGAADEAQDAFDAAGG